jgi:hypothetical protein
MLSWSVECWVILLRAWLPAISPSHLLTRVWCFESFERDFSLWWFTDRVPQFALKDEDSWGGASISGTSNGGFTFFLPPCSSSDSELSLVEFEGSAPAHLLEVCSTHNDKVEIKCMGFVGEKILIEPKLYIFFLF